MFAGDHQNPCNRAAYLGDDGSGFEGVIDHRSAQAEYPRERGRLHRDHLDVRHLILGNGK